MSKMRINAHARALVIQANAKMPHISLHQQYSQQDSNGLV